MRVYARWRSLDASERRLAVRAALTLAAAITFLRGGGVRRAFAWAHRGTAERDASPDGIARVVLSIERASRYLPGSTCLAESLALVRLLRGLGLQARVQIGATRGADFEAHAWVECEGAPLTAAAADRFVAIL